VFTGFAAARSVARILGPARFYSAASGTTYRSRGAASDSVGAPRRSDIGLYQRGGTPAFGVKLGASTITSRTS
jgi:hypothetical protein